MYLQSPDPCRNLIVMARNDRSIKITPSTTHIYLLHCSIPVLQYRSHQLFYLFRCLFQPFHVPGVSSTTTSVLDIALGRSIVREATLRDGGNGTLCVRYSVTKGGSERLRTSPAAMRPFECQSCDRTKARRAVRSGAYFARHPSRPEAQTQHHATACRGARCERGRLRQTRSHTQEGNPTMRAAGVHGRHDGDDAARPRSTSIDASDAIRLR